MCRSDDPAGGLSPSSRYNDLTVLSLSDILSFSSFVSEGEGERKSLFHGERCGQELDRVVETLTLKSRLSLTASARP